MATAAYAQHGVCVFVELVYHSLRCEVLETVPTTRQHVRREGPLEPHHATQHCLDGVVAKQHLAREKFVQDAPH